MTASDAARFAVVSLVAVAAAAVGGRHRQGAPEAARQAPTGLWQVYEQSLRGAKYIDLTHTITPSIPVWKGFGPSRFEPTVNPETGKPYTYAKDGFEATKYTFATDQLGTQLDPPAHWAPEYPAIDELPATYSLRPLVVIPIRWSRLRATPGITCRSRTSSDGKRPTAASLPARWSWCDRTGRRPGRTPPSPRGPSSPACRWRH